MYQIFILKQRHLPGILQIPFCSAGSLAFISFYRIYLSLVLFYSMENIFKDIFLFLLQFSFFTFYIQQETLNPILSFYLYLLFSFYIVFSLSFIFRLGQILFLYILGNLIYFVRLFLFTFRENKMRNLRNIFLFILADL